MYHYFLGFTTSSPTRGLVSFFYYLKPKYKQEETMKHTITKHSLYEKDRFLMATTGDEVDPIQDKLLRLATKLTETHAEDILYTIKKLEEWKEGYFSALLRFREDGIETIDFFDSRLELEKTDGYKLGTLTADDVGIQYIQNWLLKVEPGCQFNETEGKMPWGKTVTLVRVDLNRMGADEG